MRVVWLTDIHLDYTHSERFAAFYQQVRDKKPESVFVTGDIGEDLKFIAYLEGLTRVLECPVYFVLGNHDFYGGSIQETRDNVSRLRKTNPLLVWMTEAGIIELTPQTALIGHEGWSDGRYGNYVTSRVMLQDYEAITDLSGLTKEGRLAVLNRLGDEAAQHIGKNLRKALKKYPHVMLLMHPPPFRESCVYQGHISDDEWLPHMGCKAVGDELLRCMADYPQRQLTVLCGHTHGSSDIRPASNIRVMTGPAVYKAPSIAQVLNID